MIGFETFGEDVLQPTGLKFVVLQEQSSNSYALFEERYGNHTIISCYKKIIGLNIWTHINVRTGHYHILSFLCIVSPQKTKKFKEIKI